MPADLAVISGHLMEPFQYAFVVKGIVAATTAGALLGLLGCFVVLRGMSYIGHGLSHAIFGGFAASQLVASSWYLLGAGAWGIASALAINAVARRHRVGADAAIGVVTTASFALGVALLAKFGHHGPSFDAALFGSILGIRATQVWALVAMLGLAVAVVVRGYRALLFTTFDPDVAAASGVNVSRIDAILMALISVAILATLNVVGVTLVAAMLVIPAATVRLLTDSFPRMLVGSALLGAACGGIGMYASFFAEVPSGTMIVLTAAAVFVLGLSFGPRVRVHRAARVAARVPRPSLAAQSVPVVPGPRA